MRLSDIRGALAAPLYFFVFVGYHGGMNIVTIPKKLAQRGDLVVIPKQEYQVFSLWKNSVKVRLEDAWFWTPEWQKKEQEADEAIQSGEIKGPFLDSLSLLAALKRKKKS